MPEYLTPRLVLEQERPEDDREGALVYTPYSADFVGELKELVPSGDRRWLKHESAWHVTEAHVEAVTELALRYWPEIDLVDGDGVETTRSRDGFGSRQGRIF